MILLNFRVTMCFAFSVLTLGFVLLKINVIMNYKFQYLLNYIIKTIN